MNNQQIMYDAIYKMVCINAILAILSMTYVVLFPVPTSVQEAERVLKWTPLLDGLFRVAGVAVVAILGLVVCRHFTKRVLWKACGTMAGYCLLFVVFASFVSERNLVTELIELPICAFWYASLNALSLGIPWTGVKAIFVLLPLLLVAFGKKDEKEPA